MKGYKAFDKDLKCKGFQFEIGKTYKHNGDIKLCESGFHFCKKCTDCHNYYPQDARICEVEAIGEIIESEEDSKCVTNEIKIIRELSHDEIIDAWNSGDWNSGYLNTSEPLIRIFDKETNLHRNDLIFPNFFFFNLNVWIDAKDMTDEEQKEHPLWQITGGYLRKYKYKEAWKNSFNKAKSSNNWEEEKKKLLALPNFDFAKFEEISGITRENIEGENNAD